MTETGHDAIITAGVFYRKDSASDKKIFINARNYMSAHAQSKSLLQEVHASNARLTAARMRPPGISDEGDGRVTFAAIDDTKTHITHHLSLDENGNPLPLGNARIDAEYADHEYWPKMKAALFEWETKYESNAPAEERAFYQAFRTVLMESLRAEGAELRREKFKAAWNWFSKHKPRSRPLSASTGQPIRRKPSKTFERVNEHFDNFRAVSSTCLGASLGAEPIEFAPVAIRKLNLREIGSPTAISPTTTRASSFASPSPIPKLASKPSFRRLPAEDAAKAKPVRTNPRTTHTNPHTIHTSPHPINTPGLPPVPRQKKKVSEESKWPPAETEFTDDDESEHSLDRLNASADLELKTLIPLVRGKLIAHHSFTHTWLQDVHEDVAKWNIQRARVDEESIRRLQSSRGSTPYQPLAAQPSISCYNPDVNTPQYEGKEEDEKEDER
eukprot:CAMPEP_0198208968 /NCGR_PEP_ID=MMETSP1445-20131203/12305_1 /TAXON_ID=36898 /ORGANISM="Pyramimonas sp., Strain CCMP2087" /LENGTH=442 /DNA_ID=CAMNT_0043882577 /DNA_START=167 /DNA_END=1492 /DNA_ORIENTATION=-